MDIKEILFNLSNKCALGTVSSAADYAAEFLSKYCSVKKLNNLTLMGSLKGKNNYTILLDAHIDEVGFIVTHISDNGFLTVAKCGGIDVRHLPSKTVTIFGKKEITGVFSSIPPHLSKGADCPTDITEYKIDTALGSNAKDYISVGDYVCYKQTAKDMQNNTIMGKALDDRAGVLCLLILAERLCQKELPVNVEFLLSDAEELGLRGAGTAVFDNTPNEAIAIDVSFGNGPDISAYKCGKLGDGAMVGISPVLDNKITKKLIETAKNNTILYQPEVMGGRTSTNADVISITKSGVKTGLISVPLRNMHTNCEVLDINDILSVCDILENYIMSGGVMNA